MSTPTRTNPAYAHLAYQSAIAEQLIEDILENYVGNETSTPTKEIECTQLVREDAIVPEDEILHFVDRLKTHKAQIDRELTRFEFVRRDDEQGLGLSSHPTLNPTAAREHEPQTAPSNGEASAKRRRKRGRRSGGRSQEEPG